MTKKEYKNLTIIKNANIYDKSNDSMDILNDLLKNELNINKKQPNT